MLEYALLFFSGAALFYLWIDIYDPRGGLRYSGTSKYIVSQSSVFRKILLGKRNKDYPLKYIKVIPWAINFIFVCLVLMLYLVYWFCFKQSISIMIGAVLTSLPVLILSISWFFIVCLYIAIVHVL